MGTIHLLLIMFCLVKLFTGPSALMNYDKCKIFHFDVPHISSSCIIEENLINNAVRWSKSAYNPLIIYHYSITANQLLKSLPVRDMTIALDLSSSAIEHLMVFAVKIWMS